MLTPHQLEAAQYAILDSFTRDEFEELLRAKLGLQTQYIVPPGFSYSEAVFELLRLAERAGWTRDLVRAVYEARPNRVDLASLFRDLGLAPVPVPDNPSPEATRAGDPRALDTGPQFFYPELWRDRLAAIERQVCRVEVGVSAHTMGTGFLVGPDVLLTCYHLLEPVLTHQLGPDAARFRFDYRTVGEGGMVADGQTIGLHPTDWLIDATPYTPAEKRVDAEGQPPTPDQLDCALVRLDRPIGLEPVAAATPAGQRVRGWVRVPQVEPRIRPGDALAIVQHPQGGPQRMSLNTQAVIGYNSNRTRLRYLIEAEPGAAGSPCFDTTWNLIAVHHYANRDTAGKLVYRQGIPIAAVRDRLVRVGRADTLGGDLPADGSETGSNPPRSSPPPQPGPVRHPDDIQKDRWGGVAERDGRRVGIESLHTADRMFSFDAVVESTDGTTLEGPVLFHLHDTYPQPLIQIRKIRDGTRAVLEDVTAYGAFTIGVQVKTAGGVWVGLEFDLGNFAGLPAKFRER